MNEETRQYLIENGRKGGSRSTPAKAAANKLNAQKPRPRKSIPLDERSAKVAEMKALGKIKPAKSTREVAEDAIDASKDPDAKWDGPTNPRDHWDAIHPDEYSQQHPDYTSDL